MKVVIAAGSRFHSFYLAEELAQRGVLYKFFTGTSLMQEDAQKAFAHHTTVHRLHAFLDRIFFKFRLHKIISLSSWYAYKNLLFSRWLARQIENLEPFDLFVCWAGYATHAMSVARAKGAKIIIESGSFHIREQDILLRKEYDRLGFVGVSTMHEENIKQIEQEYFYADYIMTPAQHVKESFVRQSFSSDKVLKVPYGHNKVLVKKNLRIKNKFIVLFVGLIGVRKGIYDLLSAWDMVVDDCLKAELWFVGTCEKYVDVRALFQSRVVYKGSLRHDELWEIYAQASVLVLPSIEDGFGMVMGEAMSCEIPVIATENTGAREWIKDGREGFVIPIRRPEILAEKLRWLYEHPQEHKNMGIAARKTIQKCTWDLYGQQIISNYSCVIR